MGVTCNCIDDLQGITNDNCTKIDYGNQIVKVFFQKIDGANFDGQVGHDVTLQADWESKISATGDDKIIVIPNVTGILPSVEPVVEEGQDVPYGGREPIEYTQQIEAMMRYPSSDTLNQVETLTYCSGALRMWFLTNNNYLFGSEIVADAAVGAGFDRAYFDASTLGLDGIGTTNKIPFKVTWTRKCQPKAIGQESFYANLQNA